ncbi:hypothetical protein BH11ARM2_BH11ARM2_28170 [soil metagenome]
MSRAILLTALPLLGWWLTGLFDLDEGFYGAVVAEMNRRHEWVTPYFDGHPWFEKPILLYWLAKPTVALFGFDVGPRLPSVLCTLATVAVVGGWGERRLRPGAGVLAALVLGSSLLPVALGRMMMTDPPLVLCLTVAFLGYWEVQERPWFLVAVGAALGFGVLAKGPVALLLFFPVALYLAVRQLKARRVLAMGIIVPVAFALGLFIQLTAQHSLPSDSFLGRVLPGLGIVIAICLAPALLTPRVQRLGAGYKSYPFVWSCAWFSLAAVIAAWYLPAYQANGQTFVQKFLIEQNLGRFSGGDDAHTLGIASLPLYIPIVLLGIAPWSWWLWDAFKNRSDEDHRRGYLWAWAGTVFFFFSLSGAKLPHYVLPLFPPLALLVADRLTLRPWALRLGVGMIVFMTLFANAGFYAWSVFSGQAEAHRLIREPVVQNAPQVALYQIGRREASKGTGETRLRETSLPSLTMYLDRTPLEIEEPADLDKLPDGTVVFTRTGRIPNPVDAHFATVEQGKNYVLYRKEPPGNEPLRPRNSSG